MNSDIRLLVEQVERGFTVTAFDDVGVVDSLTSGDKFRLIERIKERVQAGVRHPIHFTIDDMMTKESEDEAGG